MAFPGGAQIAVIRHGPNVPLPVMQLDFLNNTSLNSRVTFSRGTNATLVDSAGKITYAPANLLLQSQTFDNASWAKNLSGSASAPVVTADFGVAPDGTTTADRAQFALNGGTTTGDRALVSQSVTLAVGVNYVFSIWLRSLGASVSMGIGCDNLTGNTPITVTSEWQRFTFSGTASGTGGLAYFQLRGGQTPTQANTADVLAWGAQLEPVTYQTTPGTYNATTASAYYGPRFDYDPVTLAPRGLLIEEARTNLLNYSAQFDDAYWAKGGSTVSANTTTAPDGTSTADKLVEDTSTGVHHIFNNIGTTVVSGAPYAWTIYAKAAERTVVQLLNNNLQGATFDLTNGAVSNITGGFTASATNAGNGWYRLFISANASSASERLLIYLQSGGTNTYTGNGTSGVYLWGAQLEAGAFATSYIPTVASTVSRSADVATMTGTNFSTWYNAAAGTFVADYDSFAATIPPSTKGLASANDNTGNNRVYGYLANNSAPTLLVTNGGATEANPLNSVIANNAITKSAWGYALNDFAIITNGGVAATDTSGTPPTAPNKLDIGHHLAGQQINGHIRQIAYYNTRLPNTQLQTLTAPSLASPLALDFISPTYTVGY